MIKFSVQGYHDKEPSKVVTNDAASPLPLTNLISHLTLSPPPFSHSLSLSHTYWHNLIQTH